MRNIINTKIEEEGRKEHHKYKCEESISRAKVMTLRRRAFELKHPVLRDIDYTLIIFSPFIVIYSIFFIKLFFRRKTNG